MLTGLSLSFCVCDILDGRVLFSQVDKIVAATAAPPERWDELIDGYCLSYWRNKEKEARRIVGRLKNLGMIDQPRLRGEEPHNISDGHWVKDGQQVRKPFMEVR